MGKRVYIGAVTPEYEPVFNKNEWCQIIKACQKNEVPETWKIGDQKTMIINGTEYKIDIIGKNHDTYADGSGVAPLTFQMHECYPSRYSMNSSNTNTGGWDSSQMRTGWLVNILNTMPSEVQSGIKEVSKLTSKGGVNSGINTTADKLFLLSEVEVFGTTTQTFTGEGTRYAYYESNVKTKTLVTETGTISAWWLRSPFNANNTSFAYVNTSGVVKNSTSNSTYGVAVAFCFGGTSEVNKTFGGTEVARKVKRIFLGVDSIARKVRRGYIGVGGVARPFWTGGELTYYGKVTPLSVGRNQIASATIGNYALFAGGTQSSTRQSTVDAYDKNLTRTTPTELSTTRSNLAATTVGGHALFGGGYSGSSARNTVDAYDENLTRTIATTLVSGKCNLQATSVGGYALFAGGGSSLNGSCTDNVWAYDSELTRSTLDDMSTNHSQFASTTIGNYALFGGGEYSADKVTASVDVYDNALTHSTSKSLSKARFRLSATSNGTYAIFAGGSTDFTTVDAYDNSLTLIAATPLIEGTYWMGATSLEDFAMFSGGYRTSGDTGETMTYAYDTSLTMTTPTGLSQERHSLSGATIGSYALFAGGYSKFNVVEAYTI